jgi:hypothetical protein
MCCAPGMTIRHAASKMLRENDFAYHSVTIDAAFAEFLD